MSFMWHLQLWCQVLDTDPIKLGLEAIQRGTTVCTAALNPHAYITQVCNRGYTIAPYLRRSTCEGSYATALWESSPIHRYLLQTMEVTSADGGVKWWLLWPSLSGSSILLSPLVWSCASWGIWPLWKSFQKDHKVRCGRPRDCSLSDCETAVKPSLQGKAGQVSDAGVKKLIMTTKNCLQECGHTEANHHSQVVMQLLWDSKFLSKQVSAKCFSGWMHN